MISKRNSYGNQIQRLQRDTLRHNITACKLMRQRELLMREANEASRKIIQAAEYSQSEAYRGFEKRVWLLVGGFSCAMIGLVLLSYI